MPRFPRRSPLVRLALPAVLLTVSVTAGLVSPATGVGPVPARMAARATAGSGITRVLVISVDGLNPQAIRDLGRAGAPTFYRLMDEGASTLNARTEYEQTETLPNHTGMVTSRRITASRGGHGVTWNDDRLTPLTVQKAVGHPVSSVFRVVSKAGGSTASFVSKQKLSLFKRSWDSAIDRQLIRTDNSTLVTALRRDLVKNDRVFTLLHLSAPDQAGHAFGFMGPEYHDAVAATDARLGLILRTIDNHAKLSNHLAVIVVADHGGRGARHYDPTKLANYRIPFLVWGPGVAVGKSLYGLNPDYQNPGTSRPKYGAAKQPVRNGDAGNLALDLLGLPAIPGSELDAGQDLDVLAP